MPNKKKEASSSSSSSSHAMKRSGLHKTMWYMHRRMVTGTMILSILLLYALAVAVYSNLSHAKMFSFGWSNRIVENPGMDAVASLYRDNTNTTSTMLDSILKSAYKAAMCRPVLFSGGLQWQENQVSPNVVFFFWFFIKYRPSFFDQVSSPNIAFLFFIRYRPRATASATPTSNTSRQSPPMAWPLTKG